MSSFGPSRRRWAVRVGVDPAVSRWRWPRPVVIWPAVFVLGPSMRRPARRVVLPPFALSCGPTCYQAVWVVVTSGLGVSGGEGRGKGKNEPRLPSRLVLVTH